MNHRETRKPRLFRRRPLLLGLLLVGQAAAADTIPQCVAAAAPPAASLSPASEPAAAIDQHALPQAFPAAEHSGFAASAPPLRLGRRSAPATPLGQTIATALAVLALLQKRSDAQLKHS